MLANDNQGYLWGSREYTYRWVHLMVFFEGSGFRDYDKCSQSWDYPNQNVTFCYVPVTSFYDEDQ